MAEGIYSWMQNLACFFILASAVMHFLPENSYKKYVQFYMGLLVILVILSPVFHLTDLEDKFQGLVQEFQDTQTRREEWQERAEDWEDSWNSRGEEAVRGREVMP